MIQSIERAAANMEIIVRDGSAAPAGKQAREVCDRRGSAADLSVQGAGLRWR